MSCPPAQASPTHARVAAVRILAPASSGTVLTSESAFRTEYRIDLLRAVLYDREDVLGNLLGNHSLDDDMLIDSIAFAMEKNCSDELREIARMSASISHDEKAMCKPLKKIFARIEAAMVTYKRGGTRAFFRQTIAKDDERVRLEDPLFPEAFYGRPDFLVADVPSRASHRDHNLLTDLYPSQELLRWRQCPAFIEVKASSAQSPTGAPKGDSAYAKETLVQGADYARMILASRPFQMHAYGVFICGSQLTVGLFDRSGISLSPNMDITKPTGLRTLVHIMVRMLWEMSPVDLGLDPTVELLPGETFCQPQFPRFRVTVSDVSGSTSCVETVGPPLWVSHSLLGRGTSVWSALTADHIPVILKTAWHTPGRIPEAEIYKKIAGLLKGAGKPYPRGIARMITGGDVSHDGAPVSVARLRDLSTDTDPPFPHDHNIVDRILHRVVLEDYGKPLWEWSDIKELGLALLDVVEGHKLLYEHGMLHRDISAGNILIRVAAKYMGPTRTRRWPEIATTQPELAFIGGFLTDFELASFKDLDSDRSQKTPGDPISGTPLFMATEVLLASLAQQTITRTLEHDLESVCWVIVYVLFKHGLDHTPRGSPTHHELRSEFDRIFSAASIQSLKDLRYTALGPSQHTEEKETRFKSIRGLQRYTEQIHEDLAGFLDTMWWLLQNAQPLSSEADTDVRPKFRDQFRDPEEVPKPKRKRKPGPELSHETLLRNIRLLLSEQM